ncbi:unnamed protein product [Ilex paraguariensis]|uniref:Uncharacterized protein n=1 Tax=Ilex paraguariensis TaxID=185542 RepID=A0ABC8T5S3_9AQUA
MFHFCLEVQLLEKNPEAAIVLFWRAINARDRVDSALKNIAVVMKQLDRTDEAIEAIKFLGGLCPKQTQESLDNLLIYLYKGNLGWAYIQKTNYLAAEARHEEARSVLEQVLQGKLPGAGDIKSRNRAEDLWREVESWQPPPLSSNPPGLGLEDDDFADGLARLIKTMGPQTIKKASHL